MLSSQRVQRECSHASHRLNRSYVLLLGFGRLRPVLSHARAIPTHPCVHTSPKQKQLIAAWQGQKTGGAKGHHLERTTLRVTADARVGSEKDFTTHPPTCTTACVAARRRPPHGRPPTYIRTSSLLYRCLQSLSRSSCQARRPYRGHGSLLALCQIGWASLHASAHSRDVYPPTCTTACVAARRRPPHGRPPTYIRTSSLLYRCLQSLSRSSCQARRPYRGHGSLLALCQIGWASLHASAHSRDIFRADGRGDFGDGSLDNVHEKAARLVGYGVLLAHTNSMTLRAYDHHSGGQLSILTRTAGSG